MRAVIAFAAGVLLAAGVCVGVVVVAAGQPAGPPCRCRGGCCRPGGEVGMGLPTGVVRPPKGEVCP